MPVAADRASGARDRSTGPGGWRPTPRPPARRRCSPSACVVAATVGGRADLAVLGGAVPRRSRPGRAAPPREPTWRARCDVEARTLFEGQSTTAHGVASTAGDERRRRRRHRRRRAGDRVRGSTPTPPAGVSRGHARRRTSRGRRPAACAAVGSLRGGAAPGCVHVAARRLPCRDRTARAGLGDDAAARRRLRTRSTSSRGPVARSGCIARTATAQGSEPAEVRAFRPGDRLRRINWAVSSRTGALHVTSTWADRDTQVLLLLDTEYDIGESEGIDGAASSLDTAVRAAAAIAEHSLRAGDRVEAHRPRAAGPRRAAGQRAAAPASCAGGARRRRGRRRTTAPTRCASARSSRGAGHRAVPARRAHRAGPDRPPRAARPHRDRRRHAARRAVRVAAADGARWRRGCGRSSGRPRSTASASSGCRSCRWRGRGTLDEVLRDVSRLALAPRRR